MAKLSRSILKEIVKECIVEIFQESFFQDSSSFLYEEAQPVKKKPKARPSVRKNQNRSSGLNNISYNTQERVIRNESFDRKIDNIANNMTNDPTFSEIFKDTARTTLQSQIGAESGRRGGYTPQGADQATAMVSQSDPTELFSESANKWAALAFSDPVNK